MVVRVNDAGIIPARAGFTSRRPGLIRSPRDHPRSRGVYNIFFRGIRIAEGSSPLARGLLWCYHARVRVCGIIPARAGFTECPARLYRAVQDHPRSRGVYKRGSIVLSRDDGSSPLARGLPSLRALIPYSLGIIPARAGFTGSAAASTTGTRGSSPLARGLPQDLVVEQTPLRIIPARAGFTAGARSRSQAHPGSSPLARGLHLRIVGIPTNP